MANILERDFYDFCERILYATQRRRWPTILGIFCGIPKLPKKASVKACPIIRVLRGAMAGSSHVTARVLLHNIQKHVNSDMLTDTTLPSKLLRIIVMRNTSIHESR